MAESNYAVCLDRLLEHEGGYVNHPDDPGGRTNKGITQRVYEKYLERSVTKQEIKDIPIDHVSDIYRLNYWNQVSADDLPSGVDFCVFDWAVKEVFYHNLPRFDVFGNGWIRRNEETREFSLHLNDNKTLYS